ncbi:MAG: 3'(2'),5'-bisphosphate nucleotidase CysQ [Syntrophobacteraceae bacterium]|nr:3'(2'),5'-bisphosphate nucleotidase CysQ [Syntrophobacteraceae bacterium]
MDFDFLIKIAKEAGRAILEVYGADFEVTRKQDHSPLTLADLRSHAIIDGALRERYPDIPVLSEEGREIPFEARKNWDRFWLVDPLDGTKEFIKRNGEFTVNIALVEGCTPVAGIIYIPVSDRAFVAGASEGCWEITSGGRKRLTVSPISPDEPVRVVRSRSHPTPGLEQFLSLIPSHRIINRGSALKFCSVAAGEADFYPRFGPTWEWDTAAGQAIVTAAGGVMVDLSGKLFVYNKQNLLNGSFIVCSSREWLKNTGILEAASKLPRL